MTPDTALEMILEQVGPAWSLWGGSEAERADRLLTYVERRLPAPDAQDDFSLIRATWLLDRLAPRAAVDRLEPLARRAFYWPRHSGARTWLLLAWGRRLQGAARATLVERLGELRGPRDAGPEGDPAVQVLTVAWSASCTAAEAESLLTWPAPEDPDDRAWDADVAGYARLRSDQAPARLMAFAREAVERIPRQPRRGPRRSRWTPAAERAIEWLFDDLAQALPPATSAPHDDGHDWLCAELAAARRGELAELIRAARPDVDHQGLRREGLRISSLAWRFWFARLGTADWPVLLEVGRRWPALLHAVTRRAVDLVPADRLDVWSELLAARDTRPMPAFCRWLTPEHRDVLIAYWDHLDSDIAACAFAAYLHKCPPQILPSLAAGRLGDDDRWPLWQALQLDRLIHAPAAARPGPLVFDYWSSRSHPDRRDPFNRRGY